MSDYHLFRTFTAQKIKFPIKDFPSKCDQIRSFLRVWSHLLEKSLMEKTSFIEQCLCWQKFFRDHYGVNQEKLL